MVVSDEQATMPYQNCFSVVFLHINGPMVLFSNKILMHKEPKLLWQLKNLILNKSLHSGIKNKKIIKNAIFLRYITDIIKELTFSPNLIPHFVLDTNVVCGKFRYLFFHLLLLKMLRLFIFIWIVLEHSPCIFKLVAANPSSSTAIQLTSASMLL